LGVSNELQLSAIELNVGSAV